jgi:hypothetical protein
MKAFESLRMSPSEFVDAIRGELGRRGVSRYLDIRDDGDRMVLELRWMGTSRFIYRVEPLGEGFRAQLESQRISPLHAPFAGRFDDDLDRALARVGARLTER